MNIHFLNPSVNIGIIEPDSINYINFSYIGNQGDIAFVHRHCGCTGEHVFLSNSVQNTIQFAFLESDTKNLTKEHIDMHYQQGYNFTKQISIYLNDNEPLMVDNPKALGEKMYNPNKKRIDLYFTGIVELSKIIEKLNG